MLKVLAIGSYYRDTSSYHSCKNSMISAAYGREQGLMENYSLLLTLIPCGPGLPLAPGMPGGPARPRAPVIPASPRGPGAPCVTQNSV